jgi:hypothetical protein
MKLDLTGQGMLLNVNGRKEYHGDESVVACDIKIEMFVTNTTLRCFDIDGCTLVDLWDKHGRPVFDYLAPQRLNMVIEHHRARISNMTFTPADIKKITIEPKANNIALLTYTVSTKPMTGAIEECLELVDVDDVDIAISPLNEELDLSQPDNVDAA